MTSEVSTLTQSGDLGDLDDSFISRAFEDFGFRARSPRQLVSELRLGLMLPF